MKKKKNYMSFFVLILLLLFITYLFLLLWENSPFKNTDLSNININGFYVNQEIDLSDNTYYEKIRETDTFSRYEIINTNEIQLVVSKDENKITKIGAYHDEENINENLLIPSVADLYVGTATFEEVIETFGNEYNQLLFSDAYEKVIYYRDRQNKIELEFCFNDDIVVTMTARSIQYFLGVHI